MPADPAAEPVDFFSRLMAAHAEIGVQLTELEKAAAALLRSSQEAQAVKAIAGVLEYFATAGARHQADEDQTLFPRLQPLPEFAQMLGAFAMQHQMNADAEQRLAAAVKAYTPGSTRPLSNAALRFAEMTRFHLVAEERSLFPLAEKTLPVQVMAELSREARARVA